MMGSKLLDFQNIYDEVGVLRGGGNHLNHEMESCSKLSWIDGSQTSSFTLITLYFAIWEVNEITVRVCELKTSASEI